MTAKYRIYCITDSQFEYIWADTPPAVCPVDAGHTVNPNSISKTKELHIDFQINIINSRVRGTRYKKVASFTPSTCSSCDVTVIKFIGYMDSLLTSYSIRMVNQNNVVVKELSFSNTEPELNTIDNFNVPITKGDIIEIQVKAVGNEVKFVYIDSVSCFIEK